MRRPLFQQQKVFQTFVHDCAYNILFVLSNDFVVVISARYNNYLGKDDLEGTINIFGSPKWASNFRCALLGG